jgi:hypothetical protein
LVTGESLSLTSPIFIWEIDCLTLKQTEINDFYIMK